MHTASSSALLELSELRAENAILHARLQVGAPFKMLHCGFAALS